MASFLMSMASGPRGCVTRCCDNTAAGVEVIAGPEKGQYSPVGMPAELPLDGSPSSRVDMDEVAALHSSPLEAPKTKSGRLAPDDEASGRPALSSAAAKAAASLDTDGTSEAADPSQINRDELARMSTDRFREARATAQELNSVAPSQASALEQEGNLPAGPGAENKPVKFRISLDKAGGKKLGLDTVALLSATEGLLQREKGALRVKTVKPEGLVSAWNSEHKRRQVREGDFIVEVNGVRGTSQELYAAISQGATLDIQLLRMP